MRIVVIIQARMGSTRLPGKVMLKLMDKPMLEHVVDRSRAIPSIHEVMIATTSNPEDDAIAEFAGQHRIRCTRGSDTNVLSRYYEAAKASGADVIARVTSDCPLLDPDVSNAVIQAFLDYPETDYCSNTIDRSFPQGLDIEVFTFAALEKAYLEAQADYELEHVTPYLYRHPDIFQLHQYVGEIDYSSYRWTVDTQEDYQLITAIYESVYDPSKLFSWREGITFMEQHPDMKKLNAHIVQKKLGE
ncbi:MAG: glycosyltransferase family protein [Paenibacillaceae bacterium]